MQLGIQFGKDVLGVNGRLGDIPDSGSFDDVTDNKFLDRFVLGDTSGTVGATDGLHVPASVLGTASVAPFASHFIHRSDQTIPSSDIELEFTHDRPSGSQVGRGKDRSRR
jgi:hypothetical protein